MPTKGNRLELLQRHVTQGLQIVTGSNVQKVQGGQVLRLRATPGQ